MNGFDRAPAFIEDVVAALKLERPKFKNNMAFVKHFKISGPDWLKICEGKHYMNVFTSSELARLAEQLKIVVPSKELTLVETDVVRMIKEDVIFCQKNSLSRMFVDDCEIGKTRAAKYFAKTRKNVFYVDCSRCKNSTAFIRAVATAIGISGNGRRSYVLESICFHLSTMKGKPLVILDEAGDLNHNAFLEIKALWNGTEKKCGWYMMGAVGLKAKMAKEIKGERVGYEEIFSRFGSNFSSIVPKSRDQKLAFYKKLIKQVALANIQNPENVDKVVSHCLMPLKGKEGDNVGKNINSRDELTRIGGLRALDEIIQLKMFA